LEIIKTIKTKIAQWFSDFRVVMRARTRIVLRALPYVFLIAGIVLCVLSAVRIFQIKETQTSQIAAEKWAGDTGQDYLQMSCFGRGQLQSSGSPALLLDPLVSIGVGDIDSLRKALDELVKVASDVSSDSKPIEDTRSDDIDIPEKKLWIDAYSTEATCNVVRPATDVLNEISSEAMLTGVGGDYLLFHPLMFVEGSFVSEESSNTQTIVLDESLSWTLFGSYHSVGMTVNINSIPYTVVGVVRKSDTKIDKQSYGDLMRAYVLFEELPRIFPVQPSSLDNSGSDVSALAIQCYEVVLPNQLDGIAEQNLISAMNTVGKDMKNFLLVKNTNRFSLLKLYDTVFPIGENYASRNPYTLPHWELSAQIAESVLLYWWAMECLGLMLSITSGLTFYTARRKNLIKRM
jgi:hypothetical protein